MFFAVSFASHTIPIVAYGQWEQQQGMTSNCSLWLYPAQDALEQSVATEKLEGQKELSALASTLPRTSRNETVYLRGDIASTLGNFVNELHRGVASIDSTNNSELSGFWEPPTNRPPGAGILVWIDAEAMCHVAIVHDRREARSAIKGLSDWMSSARRQRLLERINRWNMPEISSQKTLYIENDAAEVIHLASLFAKARTALRNQLQ
jgi:hypothetical protein